MGNQAAGCSSRLAITEAVPLALPSGACERIAHKFTIRQPHRITAVA
jgi:hypothetical protein